MADPYVTKEMTIRDLLTHRSGLGSAMGDSMLWPEPSGFSRQEIVHNLRYFHPQHGFRNQYAYSNVMYIVAAEIVSKVAGKPWEEFVDSAIFKPLEMDCYAGDVPKDKVIDSAIPYGYSEERGLFAIPRNSISQIGLASAPAGGIVCNAESMAKWLIHLLEISQPNFEDTKTTIAPIFSNKQLQQMWHPITPLTVSRLEREWNDTVLKAYGLGWRIANFYGHRLISHTGTLSGFQTNIALLPEKNLGVVLLNNGSNYGARSAVMQTVLRQFVPEALQQNWVDAYKEYQNEREAIYLANFVEPTGNGNVNLQPGDYTGKFVDQWFGKLTVEKKEDVLTVLSSRMPTLKGKLEPFEGDTWVIRWLNQNAARDAFIRFELDSENSVTSFTLYPYTTRDVKNHEWRDMHFIKQLD
jgi:CubicO group peptidase (beta-lactamase class C family)